MLNDPNTLRILVDQRRRQLIEEASGRRRYGRGRHRRRA
jgi:hypothetical protein